MVAAVCRGPAALLSGNREDGSWLFAGKRLTGFTNEEERQAGPAEKAPWLLEDELRQRGGQFEAGPPWQPYVVMGGLLVTGQTPASSHDTAEATLTALHVLA